MDKRKKATFTATHSLYNQDKGNRFRAQNQIVYQHFKERPKTKLDVPLETGILRSNICRYVADMEDKGLIQLLYKTEDRHTKSTAGYYTTDNELFHQVDNPELKLFGEGE